MESVGGYAFQQVETALSILHEDEGHLRDRLADAWMSRLSRIRADRLPHVCMQVRLGIIAAIARGSTLYAHKDVVEEVAALRDDLAAYLGLPRRRQQELAA